MGLFEQDFIDNDLAAIDRIICDYYGISESAVENHEENSTQQPATGKN